MPYSNSSAILIGVLFFTVLVAPPTGIARQVGVLANVGEEKITFEDLENFANSLPEGYSQSKTGFAADSLLLESLIDRTVLIKEAQSVGIANEPWLDEKTGRYEREQILLVYKRREVNGKVKITEEDLLQQFRMSGRDRALRIAGILVETEEEATQLRNEILSGADFSRLARERSLYEETREQGGDMGRYLRKDEISGFLEEAVFALKPGEITQPLRFLYEKKWRYTIIKLLDEIPVPLSDVEDRVAEEVFGRKRFERQQALSDSLKSAYDIRLHSENMEAFLGSNGMSEADFADLGKQPLGSYRGGQVTVNDFLRFVPEGKRDPSRIKTVESFADFLVEFVIPTQLFIEEARAAGMHNAPDILQKVEAERFSAMLDTLRVRGVDRLVAVSDDEVRSFYRSNPELFMSLEELVVNEVLLGSLDEARWVRERAEAGDSMEKLAKEYTLREEMADHGGELKISKYSHHRQLYEAAKKSGTDPGSVHGPVKTGEGFSVFKVRERTESTLKPLNLFEYRRAKAFVKIRKRKLAYVEFVRELRSKYDVAAFHDRLRDL